MKTLLSFVLVGLVILSGGCVMGTNPPAPVVKLIDNFEDMLHVISFDNMKNVHGPDPIRYLDYDWRCQRESGQPGQAKSGHLVYYLESLQTVEIVFFRHDNTAISEDGKMTHVKLYTSESENGPWEVLTYEVETDQPTGLACHLVEVVAEVQSEDDYLKIEIAEPAQFWHPSIAKVVLTAPVSE